MQGLFLPYCNTKFSLNPRLSSENESESPSSSVRIFKVLRWLLDTSLTRTLCFIMMVVRDEPSRSVTRPCKEPNKIKWVFMYKSHSKLQISSRHWTGISMLRIRRFVLNLGRMRVRVSVVFRGSVRVPDWNFVYLKV